MPIIMTTAEMGKILAEGVKSKALTDTQWSDFAKILGWAEPPMYNPTGIKMIMTQLVKLPERVSRGTNASIKKQIEARDRIIDIIKKGAHPDPKDGEANLVAAPSKAKGKKRPADGETDGEDMSNSLVKKGDMLLQNTVLLPGGLQGIITARKPGGMVTIKDTHGSSTTCTEERAIKVHNDLVIDATLARPLALAGIETGIQPGDGFAQSNADGDVHLRRALTRCTKEHDSDILKLAMATVGPRVDVSGVLLISADVRGPPWRDFRLQQAPAADSDHVKAMNDLHEGFKEWSKPSKSLLDTLDLTTDTSTGMYGATRDGERGASLMFDTSEPPSHRDAAIRSLSKTGYQDLHGGVERRDGTSHTTTTMSRKPVTKEFGAQLMEWFKSQTAKGDSNAVKSLRRSVELGMKQQAQRLANDVNREFGFGTTISTKSGTVLSLMMLGNTTLLSAEDSRASSTPFSANPSNATSPLARASDQVDLFCRTIA